MGDIHVHTTMAQHDDRALLLVSEAVSDALEVPIEELPPLSESINLDGLDAVVSQSDDAEVAVIFTYAGLRVFVHSGEVVNVRPTGEERAPTVDSSPSNCWVLLDNEPANGQCSADWN